MLFHVIYSTLLHKAFSDFNFYLRQFRPCHPNQSDLGDQVDPINLNVNAGLNFAVYEETIAKVFRVENGPISLDLSNFHLISTRIA